MTNMKGRRSVQCGEIWQARLDPITGHEQGSVRPVMIVSGDTFNQRRHGLCVIAPITSRLRNNPMHVVVDAPEGGLVVPSVVMCDQLRTVSLDRLNYRRGAIHTTTLMQVRALIQRVFDI